MTNSHPTSHTSLRQLWQVKDMKETNHTVQGMASQGIKGRCHVRDMLPASFPVHSCIQHHALHIVKPISFQTSCSQSSVSAVQYAAGYGREEMTRLLLSRGVKTSARNGTGKTAVELVRYVPESQFLAVIWPESPSKHAVPCMCT